MLIIVASLIWDAHETNYRLNSYELRDDQDLNSECFGIWKSLASHLYPLLALCHRCLQIQGVLPSLTVSQKASLRPCKRESNLQQSHVRKRIASVDQERQKLDLMSSSFRILALSRAVQWYHKLVPLTLSPTLPLLHFTLASTAYRKLDSPNLANT